MAFKALLDTLDGLSDDIKTNYKQITEGDQTGKFMLDVESVGGLVLEDVGGLKNALTSTKAELDAAKLAVKGYEGMPKPSEIKSKLEKLVRLEKLDPEKEADKLAQARLETEINALKTRHDGDLTARDARITALTGEVEKLLITNEAAAAITKAQGDPELLMPFIQPRLKMVEVDGKFSVQVLDGKGAQEYAIRDNKPVEASIEDLVAKFKVNPKFGALFAASGTSGGGANQGNRGGGTGKPNPWVKASFNLTEQMRIHKENPSLAAAMRAQAGVE